MWVPFFNTSELKVLFFCEFRFHLASTPFDKEWTCAVNPCQNGGTCKPGRAKCVCRLGYIGTYCESKYYHGICYNKYLWVFQHLA